MIYHDGVVLHPLGGASYYFRENLIKYLSSQCTRSRIVLHVGTQPNSCPHIGNTTTFAVAFALASALKAIVSHEVSVKFIYVDSAPAVGQDITINGIRYQRSLDNTGDFRRNQASFTKVLDRLSSLSGVSYGVETQNYWRRSLSFAAILQKIVAEHRTLGPHISPETRKLAIRAACPQEGCGLADKHGVNNQYHTEGRITFWCPHHGEYSLDLASPREMERLEFNTPLRNLIRVLICSQDQDTSWIMCTGSDYAGFYQEQLLWRLLGDTSNAPIIFYTPLILDWSGSKLSKAMYVEQGAYKYLHDSGLGYMLNTDALLDAEGGLEALFEEVKDWVAEPYKMFRSYSVECLHTQLVARGMHDKESIRGLGLAPCSGQD
jgi:hypothetical protein